jgi:hypothetical protein
MNTAICLATVIVTLLFHGSVEAAPTSTENVCTDSDETAYNNKCVSQCNFLTLEKAMKEDLNQYKLWTTFHHPREAFPQLLVVKYFANMTDNNTASNNDTYLWSSNAIYFVVPPHIFGLLSLFLGVLDKYHTGSVNLTIPDECACWLDKDLYYTDNNNSTLNYLEVLTEKLRWYAYVFSIPSSISDYQFQSSAVKMSNIPAIFHQSRETWTFFSFMFGLPILAVIAYTFIVISLHKEIKEKITNPEKHKIIAAVMCVGLTFAWFATILDLLAVIWHKIEMSISDELYYSCENRANKILRPILIHSTVCEFIVILIFDISALLAYSYFKCTHPGYESLTGPGESESRGESGVDRCWWVLLFPFVPPIWCLASHFGFIIIAWTSFVRHSTSFTLFYIIAFAFMFLIMRQTYKIAVDFVVRRKETDKGMSLGAILLVRLVGAAVVLACAYLIFGLWLLPVTEVVEDAPMHLYNSLQLVIVMLAILVTYQLLGDDSTEKIRKLLQEDFQRQNEQQT